MNKKTIPLFLMAAVPLLTALLLSQSSETQIQEPSKSIPLEVDEKNHPEPPPTPTPPNLIIEGARAVIANDTEYYETYEKLGYPNGDVPLHYGVCTDLIVRSFRHIDVDIQKLLHEDRTRNPDAYPTHLWEYKKADKNIDHRRCQNLVIWFDRNAESISTEEPSAWKLGDVIFFIRDKQSHPWHVGIISSEGEPQPRMIHLFPPRANEDLVERYGTVHSVYRWG